MLSAHNKISGSIPLSIQIIPFIALDLSYNKLAGTYDKIYQRSISSSSLVLEVNRLSGRFPTSSKNLTEGLWSGELNALRGNLFSCDNIPNEDEYSKEFTCGSQNLELSLYTFLIALFIGLLFAAGLRLINRLGTKSLQCISNLALLYRNSNLYMTHLRLSNESLVVSPVDKIALFVEELGVSAKIFLLLFLANLIVCIPFFGVKFSEYGSKETKYTTHSYQYRWAMSTAFVKGLLPALLLMLIWLFVVIVMVMLLTQKSPLRWVVARQSYIQPRKNQHCLDDKVQPSGLSSKVAYAAILLLNVLIMGAVNGLYIYYANQALSPAVYSAMQLAVALFKVGWNMAVVPLLVKSLEQSSIRVKAELTILIFNNVLIPCIVTAFTSPACFQVCVRHCSIAIPP